MNFREHKEGDLTVHTYDNGSKRWFLNGIKHRVDGPAVEYSDGTKFWYLNGQYHREDGPAIEFPDGEKQWWSNGNIVYNDEENNLKHYPDISESFKKSIIKYELQRT